jgi:hypothetical protein
MEVVFFLCLPLRVPMLRMVLDSADLVPPIPDLLLLHHRLFFFSVLCMHSSPSTRLRWNPPLSLIDLILGFHFVLRCVDGLVILIYWCSKMLFWLLKWVIPRSSMFTRWYGWCAYVRVSDMVAWLSPLHRRHFFVNAVVLFFFLWMSTLSCRGQPGSIRT